jgi:lysylphosphatidylglycerol synthetase-like protein (DUF2156 family)
MLPSVEAVTAREGYELWRPNRDKAQNKTTKAIVALVLLISAALLLIITIGGWERLQGASMGIVTILWALMYVVFAFLIMRWNRGLLPVTAALAIILAIFAAIAAPDWFARSKDGLDSPALPEDLLGVLTVIVVPVQILLIAISMIAFNQEWHVEEERPIGGRPLAGEDDDGRTAPPGPAEPSAA